MAIMVAGGLTFAIPGADPASAEVTTTNPHLYVSAEGQNPNNMFGEGNIIEVIIRDDSIGDTDKSEAEPEVTVNGADLRMLQTANGDWRAYFADASSIAAIDDVGKAVCIPTVTCPDTMQQLNYGEYCSAEAAASISGLDLSDSSGAYFPSAPTDDNCEVHASGTGHPLIREAPGLTEYAPGKLGQLGLASGSLWPFIQVFDLASADGAEIEYNKGGSSSRETVTLVFEDPPTDVSLDREKYPRGASVHITIDDYRMNIDPTDEDVWTLATGHGNTAAYYNLFDEGGELLNYGQALVNYQDETPDLETLSIARNVVQGGAPLIDCRTTPDFGMLGDGNDFLVSDENGICVVSEDGAAGDVFAPDNLVLNFVEDGPNDNEFVNWAEGKLSNLVVRDDAARSHSFQIQYGPSGSAHGAVGHFFAELALDAPDDDWNAGERIGVTLTDGDNNANPLVADDLSVADPGSLAIPSIRMGSPITLASAQGPVEWNDLYDGILDATPPTITLNPSTPRLPGTPYVDAGAACIDGIDPNPVLTVHNPVDATIPGTYTVTYACIDSSGNVATATRTVVIVVGLDEGMPTITLNGQPTVSVPRGGTYTDAGAACIDGIDPNPVLTVHNPVDATRQGTYTVTYTCADDAGNVATATRTVNVAGQDRIMPLIVLNGQPTVSVPRGGTYTDAGAACIDGIDPNPVLTVHNPVDATRQGTYTVTYTCADDAGNVATATRTVIVGDSPLSLDTVTAGGWDDGSLVLRVTGKTTLPSVMLDSDAGIDGLPVRIGAEFGTGNIDDTVTITDISVHGSTGFYLTAGGVQSNVQTVDIPNALGLTGVAIAVDVNDEPTDWSDGTIRLNLTGTVGVSSASLVTSDGTLVAAEVPITNVTAGSIDSTDDSMITLDNISLAGKTVQFELQSGGVSSPGTAGTTDIPAIVNLTSIAFASPDELWTGGQLALTVQGSENVGNVDSANLVNLVAMTADGYRQIGTTDDVNAVNEEITLSDIRISGNTEFRLNLTDASGNNTMSDPQTLDIPKVLELDAAGLPATVDAFANWQWATGGLSLSINGTANVTTSADNPITLVIDGAETETTVNDLATNSGVANVVLTDSTLQDERVRIGVTYTDAQDRTVTDTLGTAVRLADTDLRLASVTPGAWDVTDGTLPLAIEGNTGGFSDIVLYVDDAETGLAVTSGANGAITAVADLADIGVSGATEFTLGHADGIRSNTVQEDVPPAFLVEDVQIDRLWFRNSGDAFSSLLLQVTGYENVTSTATVNIAAFPPTGAAVVLGSAVTGDATTGALDETVTLGTSSDGFTAHSNQDIQIHLTDGTVRSGNHTLTVPSALILDDLTIDRTALGKMRLMTTGASFLDAAYSNVVLAIYGSTGADSTLVPTERVVIDTTTRNPDGSFPISGTNVLDAREDAAVSGKSVYIRLEATDGTNTVHSETYRVALPAAGSGNSVDMAPTPASSPYSGFPPITRAVVSSMDSDVPAIHRVLKEIVPHAQDRIAHTFDTEVEAFSDRLRLAEPAAEDLSITGTSKLVIKNWEAPIFMDGVATLFHWNFDSLASHGADITGIFLANGTHKVQLAEGRPSGLEDITGMRADLAALGGADRHLVITMSGYVPHLRGDTVLVADFFTFGQNDDGGMVNNAIYRIELEESGTNSADYRGTVEYARIGELDTTGDPAAYASLRPTSDQISIIVHEDVTDEYSARINYLDLDANGASTVVAVLLPPFEEAPVLSDGVTVTFRGDPYSGSVGQRVQIAAYLANGQASAQGFTYIVQILDADGDTVTVSRITSTAGAGQVLGLSTPWIPTEAGTYTATAFAWEPADKQAAQDLIYAMLRQGAAFAWDSAGNPAALLPPVTAAITVS